MCNIMHTKHVQGKLLPSFCNHVNPNALKYEITITSKANPFGGHVIIGKMCVGGHGIQNHSFDVVLGCTHLNPLECQQNWNALLIFHHINMDVNPLLCIDSGDLIYIDNNIVNF